MLDIISGIERIFPTDQMFATAWTNSPGSTFCFGLFLPEQTQFSLGWTVWGPSSFGGHATS